MYAKCERPGQKDKEEFKVRTLGNILQYVTLNFDSNVISVIWKSLCN